MQVISIGANRTKQIVVVESALQLNILGLGFGGHQYWCDTDAMTRVMKILQVERVVPDLIKC